MISKSDTKIRMDIYTKPTHSLQIQRSLLQEAYNRNITIETERAKYNVHVIFQ